ncbi:hypothetical protein Glove_281g62 [Diversispora epigaea]|uniref:RNase H type-1 domain-containing protein n=1 Tax=Diversispora epigaea TaxID=1348612 RepID=A0A397I2A3_9GLOM|nr:hypothetical protein Glove_281g62 [Diversispora epigaea]
MFQDGKKSYQQKLMKKKINYIMAMIQKARTTDKQSRYIINHILIPQIEYLVIDYIPSESWLNKQNKKIRTVFKHKCNLARVTKGRYLGKEPYWYKTFENKLYKAEFNFAQQYNYINIFNSLIPINEKTKFTVTKMEQQINRLLNSIPLIGKIREKTKPNERLNTNNKGLIPKLIQLPESILNFCQQEDMTAQIINQQNSAELEKEKTIIYFSSMLHKINNVKEKINQSNVNFIEAFTDGSCITGKIPGNLVGHYTKKTIMGYGIVIKINQEIITLKEETSGQPFSTRAELIAIAVLIDTLPKKINRVKINTDSNTVIMVIKGFVELNKRKKKRLYKNTYLLQTIKELIDQKNIKVDLIKVKSHTGIELNELADKLNKLAKEGCKNGNPTKINPQGLKNVKYFNTVNDKPIDLPIQEYMKEYISINHLIDWKMMYRTTTTLSQWIITATDWEYTQETLMYTSITNPETSEED